METAQIMSSPVLRFSSAGDGIRSSKLPFRQQRNFRVCFSARDNTGILSCEFSDSGHMQYYQSPTTGSGKKEKLKIKETKTEKKKMKLIKRLAKDLDYFSQTAHGETFGSRLMGEVKGKMISEATEILLAELENLRAEKKEQTRKRKEEKTRLMKSKAMTSSSSSSSSSESSDCDGGKVVDMRSLRNNSQQQITENLSEHVRVVENSAKAQNEQREKVSTTSSFDLQHCSGRNDNECSGSNGFAADEISNICAEAALNTKIEICIGGKCKKLGAPMLLEEFERKIGTEGSVVGCKCMGKCKNGPNVRVSNSLTEIQEENIKCSIQTPTNPLYIGVGLEDVGAIVANLLNKNRNDDCMLAAS